MIKHIDSHGQENRCGHNKRDGDSDDLSRRDDVPGDQSELSRFSSQHRGPVRDGVTTNQDSGVDGSDCDDKDGGHSADGGGESV